MKKEHEKLLHEIKETESLVRLRKKEKLIRYNKRKIDRLRVNLKCLDNIIGSENMVRRYIFWRYKRIMLALTILIIGFWFWKPLFWCLLLLLCIFLIFPYIVFFTTGNDTLLDRKDWYLNYPKPIYSKSAYKMQLYNDYEYFERLLDTMCEDVRSLDQEIIQIKKKYGRNCSIDGTRK
ncbi:hypothetical protein [Enterococcus faecium]|uniref:hypothetical protein n=1 Tax=Enterococcus faecium TaxID=1352 RepID=UPI0030C7B08D